MAVVTALSLLDPCLIYLSWSTIKHSNFIMFFRMLLIFFGFGCLSFLVFVSNLVWWKFWCNFLQIIWTERRFFLPLVNKVDVKFVWEGSFNKLYTRDLRVSSISLKCDSICEKAEKSTSVECFTCGIQINRTKNMWCY